MDSDPVRQHTARNAHEHIVLVYASVKPYIRVLFRDMPCQPEEGIWGEEGEEAHSLWNMAFTDSLFRRDYFLLT